MDPEDADEPEADEARPRRKTRRDQELSGRAKIADRLQEVFAQVQKGFSDQRDRADGLVDNWDAYNCKLGVGQVYTGNSEVFVPIVRDAVDARKTRFVNQMFPNSGRNVECVTSEVGQPDAIVALAEHYIRAGKLRTKIAPALCKNGDIEGQYNLYVGWKSVTRHIARKVKRKVEVDGSEIDDEYDDIEEEEIEVQTPDFEVLSDADVLILPVTCNGVEDAIEKGGSVSVRRRWSKAQIRAMIKRGEITKAAGDSLLDTMIKTPVSGRRLLKQQIKAAGIKGEAAGKYAEGYETWTRLEVDGEDRLCVARWCGDVLGAKLCPFWSDLCPVISEPQEKVADLAKGVAPVTKVLPLQVFANDMANAGADTAYYAAMPIIVRDPQAAPSPLILGLAAIWNIDPQAVKFMQFPELWKQSQELIGEAKTQIFQSLGVNPAMMPQSTGGPRAKRNQAEIAQEQAVDMLTTADACATIEEVWNAALARIIWYDHQYRDEDLLVRQYGEMGRRAMIDAIEPVQMEHRFEFRWLGVEAARNAAASQQKMANLNVLRSITPQMIPGKRIDLSAVIVDLVESVYGPRVAPLTIIDQKYEGTIDPETENRMLQEGFDLAVHQGDDDPKHIQSHFASLQEEGDEHGVKRKHIQLHQMQMQAKTMAQRQAMIGGPGGQGGQGGGQSGPGGPQAGQQPGAMPQNVRPLRGPPGMIAQDQMVRAGGGVGMPRKT